MFYGCFVLQYMLVKGSDVRRSCYKFTHGVGGKGGGGGLVLQSIGR